VVISSSLTIGLSVTHNLQVFEALSFLVGVVTVVPQILLPLAADLTPPERRASAISIVLSGLLFGILIARVLAGVIANFTSWRVVYYMAIGLQYLVLVGAYLIIPDYPAKNKGLTYLNILTSMTKYAFTEPKVIQAAIVNIASSACFTNFWVCLVLSLVTYALIPLLKVTLTFLLGGPPYHYSTYAFSCLLKGTEIETMIVTGWSLVFSVSSACWGWQWAHSLAVSLTVLCHGMLRSAQPCFNSSSKRFRRVLVASTLQPSL
jgi:predicted MFS family arabinose efflux permease